MKESWVKNAADIKQVKSAEKKEKYTREDELRDVAAVLQTGPGRRFIWRYISKCGVYQSSFTGNSTTFFKEGERNIGLQIIADIMEADPKSYITMMQEKGDME